LARLKVPSCRERQRLGFKPASWIWDAF
jgi:hypothetical protein